MPNSSNSTDSFGNFAITINSGVFTSNGLKTIEIYTTDDAGAVSNKVSSRSRSTCRGSRAPTRAGHPDSAIDYQHPGVHE